MTNDAVLYAAKSTADKKGSIPDQFKDGHALANDLGKTVVGEYKDENVSGYHHDRGPGLAAALDHVEAIQGTLIVQHTDRLCRGDGITARHLVELYFWALRAGVTIRSKQDDSTFENLIMTVVMGERNHHDSKRKAAAVAAGLRRRVEKGLPVGSPAFGYKISGENLSIDRAAAAIVIRIFTEADQGRSNMAIARALAADGIPTVSGRGYWRPTNVAAILKNPTYIGMIPHKDGNVQGKHDPIINLDMWERVRRAREERRNSRSGGRGRPTAGTHLLTRGLLRCHCGDAMSPRTYRRPAPDGRCVYQCLRHVSHPDQCSQTLIDAPDIDQAVFSYFERLGLNMDATRAALTLEANRKASEVNALLDQARGEAARADESLTRVKRDYTRGDITVDDWKALRFDLEAEQAAALEQVNRLSNHLADIETGAKAIDAETQLVQRMTEIRNAVAGRVHDAQGLDAVRAAIKQTFSHFELRPVASRPVPADLAWVGPDLMVLEPVVRPEAIEEITPDGRAVLAPQELKLAAETIDSQACRSVICFEPIPIGGSV